MRSTLTATAVILSALKLANAQTFTDCNPLTKTCPADPGLGTTLTTDFTKGESSDWTLAAGTSMSYGANGAQFVISKGTDAPTVSSVKYIMFGKVDVTMRACAGTGTVSSFILESDDLDEIDWEWLGSTDTSVESNFFGKGNTTTYDRAIYHPVGSPIENFITYTIDWTKDYVKWYIAGNLVRTLNYGDALALGGKNFPQTPMRIKMGNWIGCLDAAAAASDATKGTCEWAGGYVDFSAAPFTMYVQSVTIQDYGCGGDYTYTDNSGSYQSISSSCSSGSTSGSSSSSKSSSASSSSSTKAPSSSSAASTSSGDILKETSSSDNSTTSTSSSSSSSTTLASVTASTTTKSSSSSTSASATTSKTPSTSSSAGDKLAPKHKYGLLDAGVMVLGLGLGYLVM